MSHKVLKSRSRSFSLSRVLFAGAWVLSLAGFAQAKTIALWPIEFGEGTVGLSSVGPVTTALTKGSLVTDTVIDCGTGVPASYALGLSGVDFTNRTSYASGSGSSGYHFTIADFGARYCAHTNSAFTVEGYCTFSALPTGSAWVLLVGSQYAPSGTSTAYRWHISVASDDTGIRFGYKPNWGDPVTAVFSPYLDADELLSLTNAWNHFAYTYRKSDCDGLTCTRFYFNGKLMFDDRRKIRNVTGVSPYGNLDFGGLSSGAGKVPVAGAYDYIRVSDEALTADEFLNVPHAAKKTPTVAYWPLDWTSDGLLNTRPSVGSRQLNGLMPGAAATDLLTDSNADYANDEDAGTPANLTMTPAPTGSTSNKGCAWLHDEGAYIRQASVGAQLSLTNSFTVEGWIRHSADALKQRLPQKIFSTDHSVSGWTLALACDSFGNPYYRISAGDNKTQLLDTYGTDISGTLSDLSVWRHLALVYDHATGNGTWTLYLDGVQKGTVANSQAPACGSASATLTIGDTGDFGFRGYLDYVRVCRAALAPGQFLNAASGTGATDVLALWPLDVTTDDGVRFDGRDAAAGTYPLAWARTGNAYKVSPFTTDLPKITHPDKTPGFVGDPTAVTAATEFYKSSSVGNRSYLMSTDPQILDLLNSRASYTIECFVRRNSLALEASEWYVFGSYCRVKGNGVTVSSLLGYKQGSNGFFTHDRLWQGTGGGVSSNFAEASRIEDGKWHHVVWQREFVNDTTARYTLWLDRTCKGTVDVASSTISTYRATAFFVGGRSETSDKQQWRGAISSVRVSRGILTAKEFLNAPREGLTILLK